MPPLTKLWFIHLKPGTEIQSEAFQQTWNSVLHFCNQQSGAQSAGHSLWQDTLNLSRLVYISGYPSQESTDAADARYVQEHMKPMMELVESEGILQLTMDVKNSPLLDSIFLEAAVLSMEAGTSQDEYEKMVTESLERSTMNDRKASFTGWDVWPDILRAKKGLEADETAAKKYVILAGMEVKEDLNKSPSHLVADEGRLIDHICLRKILE